MPGGFGAGMAGMAFAPQGYDVGADSYWRRIAAEREAAAMAAYGRALQGVGPAGPALSPSVPPGAPATPGAGTMPWGISPSGLPPGAGGPPGPPPGPRFAGAQPAMPGGSMPGPPPVVGAGGPGGGAVGGPPPGWPPPGFVNPLRVAGQPQNLTGPMIRPGGNGPQPPAGYGGQPGGPMLPGGAAPGGSSPMFTGQQPGAQLDQLIQRIVTANPGASPDVIARAVQMSLPMLSQQDQQLWRQMQIELAEERLRSQAAIAAGNQATRESIAAGHDRTRETIASQQPGVFLRNRFLDENPDATADQIARFMRSVKGVGSANMQLLERFYTENPDATAADGLKFLNSQKPQGGKAASATRSLQDRYVAEHPDATAEDIAQFMASSRSTGPLRSLIDQFKKENPNATAQDVADFLKSQKPPTAAAGREAAQTQSANSLVSQIDGAIADLQASQHGGPPVAGMTGAAQRYYEWGGGLLGRNTGTAASDFQTKIRLIQQQLPRVISGTTRLAKDEREHLEEVVRGLGRFTNAQQAQSALEYVKSVILSRIPGESGMPSFDSRFNAASPQRAPAPAGASTRSQRSSQQPVDLPADFQQQLKSQMHEGDVAHVNNPDGTQSYWRLQNGELIQVLQ
jgi:hypothetical protein